MSTALREDYGVDDDQIFKFLSQIRLTINDKDDAKVIIETAVTKSPAELKRVIADRMRLNFLREESMYESLAEDESRKMHRAEADARESGERLERHYAKKERCRKAADRIKGSCKVEGEA